MTLAKRFVLSVVQRLTLGGYYHLDPLRVDLFKLFGVGIPGVAYRHCTGLIQYLVGLVDLLSKLIDITSLADRFGMDDQPMTVVDHALDVVAGMAPLSAFHQRAVRVGQIELVPPALFQGR